MDGGLVSYLCSVGTVRLSVYYHEPSRRSVSTLSSRDGVESPSNKQQQQIKGMIFDKNSRSYYPADSSAKQQKSPTNGLVDLVMLKLNVGDEDAEKPKSGEIMTTGKRLLNAARNRLRRRKD